MTPDQHGSSVADALVFVFALSLIGIGAGAAVVAWIITGIPLLLGIVAVLIGSGFYLIVKGWRRADH